MNFHVVIVRFVYLQDGTGSAVGFRFQNVEMNNVSYPIIIDQNYCDSPNICPVNEVSLSLSNMIQCIVFFYLL